jgi:2-methylcitrate dehydratase PrpD
MVGDARLGRDTEVTRMLAEHAANLVWRDVPHNLIHEAKRALIDYFGVVLAGAASC